MKAWVLVKKGKPEAAFELREQPDPTPGPGEVLVESEGFGLNYADVMARLGLYPECPPLPTVIGYENVGRIKETGSDVTGLQKGDRVLAFTRFGGYADHVISPAIAVAKIPEELALGEAAALATQYVTAYYATEKAIMLHEGDHVLIHAAAGGVGTALIQLLKRKGCILFGTAGAPAKMEYLKSLGVDYPINYREVDYQKEIERLGFRGKLDATFNPIGGNYVKKDFKLLNSGGRLVLYGVSKMSDAAGNIFKALKVLIEFGWWNPIRFLSKSKSLIGINMLHIADNKPEVFQNCLKEIISLAESGTIKPIVGREFTSDQLADAHEYLGSRKSTGKVAVRWK